MIDEGGLETEAALNIAVGIAPQIEKGNLVSGLPALIKQRPAT